MNEEALAPVFRVADTDAAVRTGLYDCF